MQNPGYQSYQEANFRSGDRGDGLIGQLSYTSRQNLQNAHHHNIPLNVLDSKTQPKQASSTYISSKSGSK